jgi:hypothetical protein
VLASAAAAAAAAAMCALLAAAAPLVAVGAQCRYAAVQVQAHPLARSAQLVAAVLEMFLLAQVHLLVQLETFLS